MRSRAARKRKPKRRKKSKDPSKIGKFEYGLKPAILRLPDELLLQIGRYLSPSDVIRFSHTSKKLWSLFARDSATWKRLLSLFNITHSSFIEDTLEEEFEKVSENCCRAKTSFGVHRQMQIRIGKGDIVKREKCYFHCCLNKGDEQHTFPFISYSSSKSALQLEMWDEESGRSQSYKWPLKKFPVDISFDSRTFWGRDQLIVKEDVAIFRFITERNQQSLSAVIIGRIGYHRVTTLWQQTSVVEKYWWIGLIRDKIFKFVHNSEKDPGHRLEISTLHGGKILKTQTFPKLRKAVLGAVRSTFYVAHNEDFLAATDGEGITVFDIAKDTICSHLEFSEDMKLTNALSIKGDRIFAPFDDGSVSIWHASTGSLIRRVPGSKSVSGILKLTNTGAVLVCDRKVIVYQDCKDNGLVKLCEKSLLPLRKSTIRENTEHEVAFNEEEVSVFQNVIIISYTVKREVREKIKQSYRVAFLPLNGPDRVVIKQIKTYGENFGDVETDYPMSYAVTATSLLVYFERFSSCLICKFFNKDCVKRIVDPDDSDMSDLDSYPY